MEHKLKVEVLCCEEHGTHFENEVVDAVNEQSAASILAMTMLDDYRIESESQTYYVKDGSAIPQYVFP